MNFYLSVFRLKEVHEVYAYCRNMWGIFLEEQQKLLSNQQSQFSHNDRPTPLVASVCLLCR